MKVSLFLSVTGMLAYADHVSRQAILACASVKFAANVTPYYSCLEGGKGYYAEPGCRIDLLSVAVNRQDDILYLWKRLSEILDIGCLHMEISSLTGMVYQGCICKWPYYRANYRLVHEKPVICADDSWHGETPEQRNARLNAFEADSRPRDNKPLC